MFEICNLDIGISLEFGIWDLEFKSRLVISRACDIVHSVNLVPMALVLIIYIILLAIFLVMCALIFRHTVKYGYLSPRFRVIVTVFGILALGIIIFSLYLVFQLFQDGSPSSFSVPTSVTTPTDIQF